MRLRLSLLSSLLTALPLQSSRAAEPASPIDAPPPRTSAHPSTVETTLWYSRPAAIWNEALPVGNGRLGAMVFGGIADERIQFNEDTLWTGHPHDYVRSTARDALPELRRLIAEGNIKDAEKLGREKFISDPVRQKAYQPFGDLRFHFIGQENATDYRRELDLDSAVARVSYRVGDVAYRREVFASHPANVIFVRLTADRPAQLGFTLALTSPHKSARTTPSAATAESVSRRDLILAGQVAPDGLRFEARVRLIAEGGRLSNSGDTLTVEHADAVTLVVAAATSFKNFQDISADPAARCDATLAALERADFASLRAAHITDHQRLFRRVALDLGTSAGAALPTDERLRHLKTAPLATDPALAALFFNYGRYLLIASSRPGGQPANLQGIWNELLDPPWESKWTTNINVEMNYWPAELTNLAECHEPLFDLIDDLRISGARTAREQYGAGGWVLHHNTDLWRGTAPINNIDGIWPTGGAWLCYHLWEHWLFTGDRDFLARRAYPAMKEASQFFADYLVKDPKTGWLVTTPSYSPEQGSLTTAPTMDNQLIRALLGTTIEAAAILGRDREFAENLAALRAQLPPNQIGKHGQLQEWLDDVDKPDNAHRHMSPLWALYPGADITPADPKIYDAAKLLLRWRGDGSTGWSYAWRIPLWARVGDAEFAYRQLGELLAKRTLPNLFDLCGPFQIDGNFGGTAGVAEMLLQSHQRTTDGKNTVIVDLLPALPKAWPTGSVTGLCARDGLEIDLAWQDGTLTHATVRSKLGRPFQLRYAGQTLNAALPAGAAAGFDTHLRPIK
jgi:alpha-L-fucosidase 2